MRSILLITLCTVVTTSLLVTSQVLASPQYGGRWGTVFDWPFRAQHVILTPQGNILTASQRNAISEVIVDVWNPLLGTDDNSHNTLASLFPIPARSTSGSAILLPESGNVLFTGTQLNAANQTFIFDTETNSLTQAANMNADPRLGSVSTILPSGEILVSGEIVNDNNPQSLPEIYAPTANTWRYLSGASLSDVPYNNTNDLTQWVTPAGKVFGYGGSSGITRRKNFFTIDTDGDGSLTSAQNEFLLGDGDSVMYRPGKIFNPYGDVSAETPPPSAFIVNVLGDQPYLRPVTVPRTTEVSFTTNPMMLPNGKVMALSSLPFNFNFDSFLEVWDPASESWESMVRLDEKSELALLNSTVLLKDATILVLGVTQDLRRPKATIYYPPYLFDSSGQLVVRPSIVSAPADAAYAGNVVVKHEAENSISRVTLIKTSRLERGKSVGSRFIELDFEDIEDGISVKLPGSPNTAPPGHYLMYLLDNKGVPSEGHIIRLFDSEIKDDAYPIATDDTLTTTGSGSIIIDALANDSGVGLVLTAPNVWSLKGGNVALVDNKITYMPKAGFNGEDNIWYVFSDSQGRTNSGAITITVSDNNGVKAPYPDAQTDYVSTMGKAVTIDVLANDKGEGLVLNAPNAWSKNGGNVSLVDNKLVYKSKLGYSGRDDIWYTFKDIEGRSNSGHVIISVNTGTAATSPDGT